MSSLQDGMNLVAKEYVASQVDEQGRAPPLRFAGAAEEMDAATLVNPYDPESSGARRSATPSTSPPRSAAAAMRGLQRSLRTIFDWMHEVFDAWGAASAERGAARSG